jgi:hypothetical protein
MVVHDGCPCDGGQKQVKVAITLGLVALVVFAALCVVVGQRIAPRIEAGLGIRQEYVPGGVSYDHIQTAPLNQLPVNERAGREIKKGPPLDCSQCAVITQASSPQPARPQPQPAAPANLVAAPTSPRYSISVFVGTDPRSQEMLAWWHTDGLLQALRKQVNWQAYTRDNPLYRERYASIVPPDQFPSVIFADERGGHVYAAGGDSLPTSSRALYDAIYDANEVYKSLRDQDGQPRLQTDSAESTSPPNCPDGNCTPPERKPLINPDRTPLFPSFRPAPKNPIESILYWLWNPGEAVLAMLCAVVFLALLGVVVIKVVRS